MDLGSFPTLHGSDADVDLGQVYMYLDTDEEYFTLDPVPADTNSYQLSLLAEFDYDSGFSTYFLDIYLTVIFSLWEEFHQPALGNFCRCSG